MSLVERLNTAHRRFRADIASRAVTDHGINLKRNIVKIEHVAVTQAVPVIVAPKCVPIISEEEEISALEQQIERLTEGLIHLREKAKIRREATMVSVLEIQRIVSDKYGISRNDIISQRRQLAVVRPRQIAMYLTKELTLHSLTMIGRLFGDRDHTTVLAAIRRIELLRTTDHQLGREIVAFLAAFRASEA